ncbi:thiamine pyrophosphate enzyme [Klebsiella oxytoca]|nr:thiamine pyrophosphate enzyme [Klebsiella oxytoca]
MSEMITVGDAIARTLEQYHVEAIYGVISIHNLPIADAVGQREKIRFVPARGEAGSVTMADAHGRFFRARRGADQHRRRGGQRRRRVG